MGLYRSYIGSYRVIVFANEPQIKANGPNNPHDMPQIPKLIGLRSPPHVRQVLSVATEPSL